MHYRSEELLIKVVLILLSLVEHKREPTPEELRLICLFQYNNRELLE
jgi:hypothetical protein